ncbi:coiled-coil domain-containing protein 12 [Triticum urartu]|uniref:coiled-coil domain-containing protein 12 n=1 Tax=Triticum urartu TaxID=4572 RepID=UPI0020449366|nr:coiled-coil domain-containing protein 12 [Triticum urartu]
MARRIHLPSPLFFLLRAVRLALHRRTRSAAVPRLSVANSGRALPSSLWGTSLPARTPPWNGEHETAEEQETGPALPDPVDAPKDASKENVSPTKESDEVQDNGEVPLKFRNYLPHDERLRGGKVAPLSLPKFEDPIAADAAEPKQLENPFGNIAPKNPNWDLKRDVQKRIDKLEKRTQKALAEIALEQQKEKEALEEGSDAAQE